MKVSVIVPVYNTEKYLGKCVDSILSQSYADIELILINDGSSDRSGEICDSYAEKDSRVAVIHQPNSGVSAARNAGISAATGEFLMFVDSDDCIERDYIEALAAQVDDETDIVISNFDQLCDGEEELRPTYKMIPADRAVTDRESFFADCTDSLIYTYTVWAKLYRKSAIGEVRFSDLAFSEDAQFIRNVFVHVRKAKLLARGGYVYFINAGSATADRSKLRRKLWGSFYMLYDTLKICKENEIRADFDQMERAVLSALASYLRASVKAGQKLGADHRKIIGEVLKTVGIRGISASDRLVILAAKIICR
ncbi:MAG: glycosyltransferase family 2 protein [Acutalibacteraceae bacterium]